MTQAIIYQQYGGPDVLTLSEVECPKPGDGQVRVAVKAVGVNPMDVKIRRGDLQQMIAVDFPSTPGFEASGVVNEVGAHVADVSVGDDVLAMTDCGAYAEFALASLVLNKPSAMSWEEAAVLPTVAGAAYGVLAEMDLRSGQTLLIHGIAGSVGSVSAQLAVGRGIGVVGTCRPEDVEFVTGLGACGVAGGEGWVDRVRAAAPHGVDAVLDTAGAGLLPDSIDLVGGPGKVLTTTDNDASKLGVRFSQPDPDDHSLGALPELVAAVDQGKLNIRIWRTYRLSEAADAHRAIEDHSARGKIVLIP